MIYQFPNYNYRKCTKTNNISAKAWRLAFPKGNVNLYHTSVCERNNNPSDILCIKRTVQTYAYHRVLSGGRGSCSSIFSYLCRVWPLYVGHCVVCPS